MTTPSVTRLGSANGLLAGAVLLLAAIVAVVSFLPLVRCPRRHISVIRDAGARIEGGHSTLCENRRTITLVRWVLDCR